MMQIRRILGLAGLLMLIGGPLVAAPIDCWVSMYPGGTAVSWVSKNAPFVEKDTMYWINAVINPSTSAKFVLKFPENTSYDSWKQVYKFSDPPVTMSIPFLPTASILGPFSIKVKDDLGSCTAFVDMGEETFFSSDTPVAIPDAGAVSSQISVNTVGTVQRVRVAFWIDHSFDADIEVRLIGPDATAVTLTSDNGSNAEDYGKGCYEQTVFDDESTVSIIGSLAPFIGVYMPEQPLSAFSGKTGNAANGTWTLEVTDDAAIDTGQLLGWTLWIDEQ